MRKFDRILVFGGLAVVILLIAALVLFPLYRMLNGEIVRRPLWDPPEIVVRDGTIDLPAEDIARLRQDPVQREILDNLAKGFVYRPSPSWVGYSSTRRNQAVFPFRNRTRRYNVLLAAALGAAVCYVIALRIRRII